MMLSPILEPQSMILGLEIVALNLYVSSIKISFRPCKYQNGLDISSCFENNLVDVLYRSGKLIRRFNSRLVTPIDCNLRVTIALSIQSNFKLLFFWGGVCDGFVSLAILF